MDSFEKQDLEIYSMWMGEKKGNDKQGTLFLALMLVMLTSMEKLKHTAG